jgi:mannosyl-3-phosphoglycerate phosphatase
MGKKIIIFTDLDETLLERRSYSFEKALPALALLRERDIPLVICSSKTRPEIDSYRKKLKNAHPFIAENGGGLYVPKGYFEDMGDYAAFESGGCNAIILGARYAELREALLGLRSEGFDLKGFGDMSVGEISALTGLKREEAALAREREFDEAFVFRGDALKLRTAIRKKGLNMTEGRLFHLMGDSDKGKAVDILKELYKIKYRDPVFAALGDSPTDTPMLRNVDYPVLVKKDDGRYDEHVSAPNLIRAEGIGPEGWNRAVVELVNKL